MSGKPRILVVGSFVMDLVVETGRFPNAGETVLGKSFQMAPGGKGVNQAVQAARAGAEVTMVGRLGNDDFGRTFLKTCSDAGIHTDYVTIDPVASTGVGNPQIEVREDGGVQNRIIVVSGANMTIRPEHVAFLEDKIADFDMVILQLEIPMEINVLVARYAFEKKVPVMLNPAPSQELPKELLKYVTYLSPNEYEAAALSGIQIHREGDQVNDEDAMKAARVLMDQGVRNVLITIGEAGSLLLNEQGITKEPCAKVQAKDPTAAGDSFVGSFCAAKCAGMTDQEAMHFAAYTAAITVTKMGAIPSLPTVEQVTAFMKERNAYDVPADALDRLK